MPNEKFTYKIGDNEKLIEDLGLNRETLRNLGLRDSNNFVLEITKEITLTKQKLSELKKMIQETILEDSTKKDLAELASVIANFKIEEKKDTEKKLGDYLNISIQLNNSEQKEKSSDKKLDSANEDEKVQAQLETETQNALDRQNEDISSIDLDGDIDSQRRLVEMLKSGTSTLLVSLGGIKGVNMDNLLDFNNFKAVYEANRDKLSETDKILGDKILEILEKGDGNLLKKELLKSWGGKISKYTTKANDLMKDFWEATKKGAEAMSVNKLFLIMRAHPYMSAAIGIGGAIGLYGIISFIFRKKKKLKEAPELQNEKGGKWKKRLYTMGAAILAIFALGKVSQLETVIKFCRDYLNLDLDKYKVIKILRCLSNFDIHCVFRELLPEKSMSANRAAILLTKSRYYHNRYADYVNGQRKTAKVPMKRLDVLKTLQNDKTFFREKGLLDKIIEVEKKGGLDKLLSDLQNETDPKVRKALEKEISEYSRNLEQFDRKFETYVVGAKHRKPNKLLENPEFKKACERFEANELKEAELTKQSHELAKKRDAEIKKLKETQKDPKKLAEGVKKIREKFIQELGAKNVELRTVQAEMIADLKTISAKESEEAKKFLQKHKNKIKKKRLPTGKLGFVLIGGFMGHEILTGESSMEDIAWTGAEAIGGFVPFVNMGLDLNQIISGKNLAGQDLSMKERFLMAPAFLVLDTAGSLATATGIGSVVGMPLIAATNAAKVGKSAKAMKAVRNATKLAKTAGRAEGIITEAKAVEILKNISTYLGDLGITAKELMAVPSRTMFQFQESLKFAKANGIIKNMGRASKIANFTVWSSLGMDVYTCFKEVGIIEVNDDSHPLLKQVDNLVGSFENF